MKTSYIALIAIAIVAVGAIFVYTSSSTPNQQPPPPPPAVTKVNIVLYGYHDQGAWDPQMYECLMSAVNLSKNKFQVTFSENVKSEDAENMLSLAAKSNDLVIASTNVYDQAVRSVAAKYPTVKFVLESDPIGWYAKTIVNSTAYPQNVILIGPGALANNYVIGALAAKLVGQNAKLGFIQSLDIPITTHTGATFRLGAQSVYSNIQVLRDIMGDFVAPVKCRDSIAFMASQGVKAVFIEQDDTSGILECQKQGIYAIAMYKDMAGKYPDTVICSCVWNWQMGFSDIIDAVAEGKWSSLRASKWYWEMDMGNGGLTLGTFGNMVTEELKNFQDSLSDNVINYGNLKVPYTDKW